MIPAVRKQHTADLQRGMDNSQGHTAITLHYQNIRLDRKPTTAHTVIAIT